MEFWLIQLFSWLELSLGDPKLLTLKGVRIICSIIDCSLMLEQEDVKLLIVMVLIKE